MSDTLRITGMASGLDVESMIKTMMKAETAKVDKVKQSRQTIQWKQDLFRDVLTDLSSFKSTFFDVLKPENYMLSGNNYAGFDVTSVDAGNPLSAPGVTATAGAGSTAGNYTVTVNQLAKASSITGMALNQSGNVTVGNWEGQNIGFSVNNGATEIITIDNPVAGGTLSDLVTNINSKIASNGNLNGKVIAVADGGKVKFNALTTSSVKLTNDTTVASDLDNLKGKVVNPNSATTLSDLGMAAPVNFNITYNGTTKAVTFDNTKTINDAINAITTATSGSVIAKFSQLTGQFTLATSNTGSSAAISIDTTIPSLGLTAGAGVGQQDASVAITPQGGGTVTVNRASNNFNIDGISYNLVKEGTTTTVAVNSNTQKTFDKIKAVIDKYNDIVGKISGKLTEKTSRSYQPLTDEQKKSMKDEEIKAWETKAKEGLLRGDNDLSNMLRTMRKAFFDTVEGAGVSLSEIGLNTSSDITQGGKILIDETKLKNAIQTKGNQVASIFMKSSATAYSPDAFNSTRYNEEGIFQRINDVLSDYTRTTRNTKGKRGSLIEKAGIKGNLSEFTNLLSKQIADKDTLINQLTDRLADKENSYYIKFSKLESAMNQSNSQSSWLSQQLGG